MNATESTSKRITKLILFSVGTIIILSLCIAGYFAYSLRTKVVAGTVYDCDTNEKLTDVQVKVSNRWILTWEKNYIYTTKTNANGQFEIKYNFGDSAHLSAEKEGYLLTTIWRSPGKDINIGLKKSDGEKFDSVASNCQLTSECLTEYKDKSGVLHINGDKCNE
jgi:hypothetical protein